MDEKKTMCTRIIDETILKIYIPKKPEETATKPLSSLTVSTIITSNFQDKDKDIKQPRFTYVIIHTYSFIHMLITRFNKKDSVIMLNLPDNDAESQIVEPV